MLVVALRHSWLVVTLRHCCLCVLVVALRHSWLVLVIVHGIHYIPAISVRLLVTERIVHGMHYIPAISVRLLVTERIVHGIHYIPAISVRLLVPERTVWTGMNANETGHIGTTNVNCTFIYDIDSRLLSALFSNIPLN